MDFIEEITQFSKRIEHIKDNIYTEEATKTSVILPFFQLLGYDVFNPLEFIPEYTADTGIKKGEKVDQCHLVKALTYWLLFRQGYCNAYLCLIFLLKGDLSVFMQHKKTDCHLSEKKVYLILRIRLHDTENLPLT